MSSLRRLAYGLLRAVLRHSSAENEEWARAMLHELDFIENDWAALCWALGCTTAMWRQSGRGVRRWFSKQGSKKEAGMNEGGKKALGFVSGIGLAAAVGAIGVGLWFLSFSLIPAARAGGQWIHLGVGVFMPETIFVVATILLWRKRRSMALGILLFGVAAGVHVLMHFAKHWRG
jgi:hypothetical protein